MESLNITGKQKLCSDELTYVDISKNIKVVGQITAIEATGEIIKIEKATVYMDNKNIGNFNSNFMGSVTNTGNLPVNNININDAAISFIGIIGVAISEYFIEIVAYFKPKTNN